MTRPEKTTAFHFGHIGLVAVATLMFIFSLPAPPAQAEPIDTVQLTTAEGETFTSYSAGPEDADIGVLVVHDWFGITPFTKDAVKRLATNGYRVLAVDLYSGKSAATHRDAYQLMTGLDAAVAARKLDAGLAHLSTAGRRTAVFGFSMGAPHALQAALRRDDQTATIIWYGETPSDAAQLEGYAGELLAVYGSLDGDAAEQAAALSKAADAAGSKAQIFIYPQAHHAFAQPLFNAGKTYDPEAAETAWAVTLHFLKALLPKG